ncbi:Putative polyketide cyclase/dehydrase, START-like domain superfamily [Colletotrichum destructivum]|uniref:Polyketide cyclase/dehydrase, START-like domain superfamily n=1 Tax=Colletotrichum destructivum TaxID=34406 RepID=A0AAX4I745_9PEZI|nr:Putative polyketide cyclase/dehydrase, START-like domain superfamily [Colletotrichum destructivum]
MSIEDLGDRTILASVTETINAPVNEIWPFLSAIGAERILIPGCTRSAVLEGHGKGAVRRVYFGDVFFDERILECDHIAYKLKYEVLAPNSGPARGVVAAVQLHRFGPDMTTVTWVSGAKELPKEHDADVKDQAIGFCKGQIASLRKLSHATTASF